MLEQRYGAELGKQYKFYDNPSAIGKDYNEELMFRRQQFRERKQQDPNKDR